MGSKGSKGLVDKGLVPRIIALPLKTPKNAAGLLDSQVFQNHANPVEKDGFHFMVEKTSPEFADLKEFGAVTKGGWRYEDISVFKFQLTSDSLIIRLHATNKDGEAKLYTIVSKSHSVEINIHEITGVIELSWTSNKADKNDEDGEDNLVRFSCRITPLLSNPEQFYKPTSQCTCLEDEGHGLRTKYKDWSKTMRKRWGRAAGKLAGGWNKYCQEKFADGKNALDINLIDTTKQPNDPPAPEPVLAPVKAPETAVAIIKKRVGGTENGKKFLALTNALGKSIQDKLQAKGLAVQTKLAPPPNPMQSQELAKSQCVDDATSRRLAANDSMETVFSMLWFLPLLVIFVFWFKRYIVTRKNDDYDDIVQGNVNEGENDLANIV